MAFRESCKYFQQIIKPGAILGGPKREIGIRSKDGLGDFPTLQLFSIESCCFQWEESLIT